MNKNKTIIVFSWMLMAMLFGCSDSDANDNNNSGDQGFTYNDVITAYDSFNENLFQDSRKSSIVNVLAERARIFKFSIPK